jgi:hypothetical protein
MDFIANQGLVCDFDTKPWFTLVSGNGFNLNLSASQQVSGRVYYKLDAT